MKLKTWFLSSAIWVSPQLLAAPLKSEKKVGNTIRVASTDPWDYDVHSGVGFGTFTNKDEVQKSFGGVIAGITLYNERIFESQTAHATADILIDGQSQQIIKKSLSLGTDWAFVGAKKRTVERFKAGTAVSQSSFSLNWINSLAYDSFTITPNAIGIDNLQGSHMGWSTGLGLHWLLTEDASLSLRLEQTLLSFASSIEKSKSSSTDFSFGIRSYL